MVEAEGAAVHVNVDSSMSKNGEVYTLCKVPTSSCEKCVESQSETTSRDSVSFKTLKTLLQTALAWKKS